MNRSVANSMLKRFASVAQEAEFLGNAHLAEKLTRQIERHADDVREDSAPYQYSQDELKEDIEDCLWAAVVRLADFYKVSLKEDLIEELVDSVASQLEDDFCSKHGCVKGAYEEELPGEHFEVVENEEEHG
jgi:hypothetical protein